MKIGMYSSDEIYDELANGFLHHSMVDAMYFEIKKLREENQQLKKQKDDVVEYIKSAIENDDIEELKEGRHLLLWNEDLDKLLRMLGEIDAED